MSGIDARMRAIRERIDAAALRSGRDPASVRLLAASKTRPAASVIAAATAGQIDFGENRVQEADAKIGEVCAAEPPLDPAPVWHLIGPLQRNKARRAVALFDVIHSLDRAALALELDRAASAAGLRRRVLLQVNIDAEPQKAGVDAAGAAELFDRVRACESLEAIGLMAIPRACDDPEEVRPSFARLRELLDSLQRLHPDLPQFCELSMGMSSDFEVAIEQGATWVRLGTAIFGRRKQ